MWQTLGLFHSSTRIVCNCGCCFEDAKDAEDDDEEEEYKREATIQQKIEYFCYTFFSPCNFFNFHWYGNILVMHFQKLEKRIERDNTEGVEHGTDHPYLYHLDVGSHRQRLGYANETRKRTKSELLIH